MPTATTLNNPDATRRLGRYDRVFAKRLPSGMQTGVRKCIDHWLTMSGGQEYLQGIAVWRDGMDCRAYRFRVRLAIRSGIWELHYLYYECVDTERGGSCAELVGQPTKTYSKDGENVMYKSYIWLSERRVL